MKTLTILGSTGSIGGHTLDVVAAHPERLRVLAIAGRNRERLAAQARRFAVPLVGIAADVDAGALPAGFPDGTRATVTGPLERARNPTDGKPEYVYSYDFGGRTRTVRARQTGSQSYLFD